MQHVTVVFDEPERETPLNFEDEELKHGLLFIVSHLLWWIRRDGEDPKTKPSSSV